MPATKEGTNLSQKALIFAKTAVWFASSRFLAVIIIFTLIDICIGAALFYRYSVLPVKTAPVLQKKGVFDQKSYKAIVDEWEKRGIDFDN